MEIEMKVNLNIKFTDKGVSMIPEYYGNVEKMMNETKESLKEMLLEMITVPDLVELNDVVIEGYVKE